MACVRVGGDCLCRAGQDRGSSAPLASAWPTHSRGEKMDSPKGSLGSEGTCNSDPYKVQDQGHGTQRCGGVHGTSGMGWSEESSREQMRGTCEGGEGVDDVVLSNRERKVARVVGGNHGNHEEGVWWMLVG